MLSILFIEALVHCQFDDDGKQDLVVLGLIADHFESSLFE
jgi:hypothetical protein